MVDALLTIDIKKLDPDPDQPRKELEAVPTETEFRTLRGLADSIMQVGILQPIRVCSVGRGRYRIISGHRRFEAARLAGLKKVPCVVTSDVGSVPDLRVMQITENVQRKAMTATELAAAVQDLVGAGLPQVEVAKRLGIGESQISILLKLTRVSEQIKQAMDSGAIESPRAAYELDRLPPFVQGALIKEAIANGRQLTQKEVRQARAHWRIDADAPRHPYQAPILSKEDFDAVMAVLVDGIEDDYDPLEDRDKFFGDTWREQEASGQVTAVATSPAVRNSHEDAITLSLRIEDAYNLIKQLGIRPPKSLTASKHPSSQALTEWLQETLVTRLRSGSSD